MVSFKDIKSGLIQYFKRQKRVICVYIFGSAANGRTHRLSDIDIAVLFDEGSSASQYARQQLSLMDELSHLMKREVDAVILNTASPFLKYQILKTGHRIYERADRREHAFEVKSLNEYFDFLPIRTRMVRHAMARLKKGIKHG